MGINSCEGELPPGDSHQPCQLQEFQEEAHGCATRWFLNDVAVEMGKTCHWKNISFWGKRNFAVAVCLCVYVFIYVYMYCHVLFFCFLLIECYVMLCFAMFVCLLVCVRVYVKMYACMHEWMHASMYVCMYGWMYVCMLCYVMFCYVKLYNAIKCNIM